MDDPEIIERLNVEAEKLERRIGRNPVTDLQREAASRIAELTNHKEEPIKVPSVKPKART